MTAVIPAGRPPRMGMALMVTLVLLALVSIMVAGMGTLFLVNRKVMDRNSWDLQAEMLARGGIEVAIAKLMQEEEYSGEVLPLIPHSRVEIAVKPIKVESGKIFQIRCEARFPSDQAKGSYRILVRSVRRNSEGRVNRVENVDPPVPVVP